MSRLPFPRHRVPTSVGLAAILLLVGVLPVALFAEVALERTEQEAEVAADAAAERRALGVALALAEGQTTAAPPEAFLLGPDGERETVAGEALGKDAALAEAIGARASGVLDHGGSRLAWARIPGENRVAVVPSAPASGPVAPATMMQVGVVALAAGAGLLAVALAHLAVVRPLRALEQASAKVAGGDLDRRAPLQGTRETARLAGSFNEMAERLAAKQQELADLNAQLEGLVQARTEQLARAVEDLQAFNFTLAHELREPLRSLQTMVDLTRSDPPPGRDTEAQHVLETAHRRLRRLQEVIFDLLHWEDVGREPPTLQEVDLDAVVEQGLAAVAALAAERGARFEVLTPDFPRVLGHPEGLAEVIEELLENGIRYNESPEPLVQVSLVPAEADGDVVVAVDDNGIGIPPDRREEVFHPFQRLHPPGRYSGGTGIGLAVARRIVERHDGTLTVAPEPSPLGGSRFLLRLPLAGPAPRPPLPAARRERTF
ncbi:MAG TPA: ATP-binding protein [Candidatus Thermoplasmatota archaeon]|nr:ATP-binding protein [Candidatus Thermoplasmatota archaeon]